MTQNAADESAPAGPQGHGGRQDEHGDITWFDGVTDEHYENGVFYAAFPPPRLPISDPKQARAAPAAATYFTAQNGSGYFYTRAKRGPKAPPP